MKIRKKLATCLLCLAATSVAAAEQATGDGDVTRIRLEGFEGYSGEHNWGRHTAPFTLVNLDSDERLEVLVKEWRDWSYRGRGAYKRRNSVPARLYAFDHDGKALWTFDHGKGVNVGVNFAPTLAADLDGDGVAEIYTRKAEDTKSQWPGTVLSEPDHDWIVRLDPASGKEIARAAWPPHHGYPGNGQIMIGYLDGQTPAIIAFGGPYQRKMTVRAYRPDLTLIWETTWKPGQGAHTPSCADLDGDGRDEVIVGSVVLDHDGSVLWQRDLGHVDLAVAADIDPSSPGLEVLFGGQDAWFTGVVRGSDGEVLWSQHQKTHSQEGCGEFDADRPGLECFGWQDEKDGYDQTKINMWDARGRPLDPADYFPQMPRGKGRTLYLWWHGRRTMDAHGAEGLPRPGFMRIVGDLDGDWREQVAWLERNQVVICRPTGKPAVERPTLRRDRKYRAELAKGSRYFAQTHYTRPMPAEPVFGGE